MDPGNSKLDRELGMKLHVHTVLLVHIKLGLVLVHQKTAVHAVLVSIRQDPECRQKIHVSPVVLVRFRLDKGCQAAVQHVLRENFKQEQEWSTLAAARLAPAESFRQESDSHLQESVHSVGLGNTKRE